MAREGSRATESTGNVALSRFRGSASPGMPRGHAREKKYAVERLKGDGCATRRREGDTPCCATGQPRESESHALLTWSVSWSLILVGQRPSRFLLYFWLRLLGLSGMDPRLLPPPRLRLQQRRPLRPSEKTL